MNNKLFKFALVTLVALGGFGYANAAVGDYGYPCFENDNSTTDLCTSPERSLKCNINGTVSVCQCEEPTEMYWERTADACLVNADGACRGPSGSGDHPTICTPNAYCTAEHNEVGVCKCNVPKYIKSGTRCYISHGYGRCETHTECSQDAHLTCEASNSTCVCEDPLSVWVPVDESCKGLVGGMCTPGARALAPKNCIDNAGCNADTSTCDCLANYKPSPDHRCLLDINQTCTSSSECHPLFECNSDKKCTCPQGGKYDGERCALMSGAVCDPLGDNLCNDHSTCTNTTNSSDTTWTCECDSGYSAISDDMECLAEYGSPCSADEDCVQGANLICSDPNNGTCSCGTGQDFDTVTERCTGLIGSSCSNTTNPEECFGSSICYGVPSYCTCPTGSKGDAENKKCIGEYGEKCFDGCNSEGFVVCDSSINLCSCPDSQGNIFDSGKCYAKVGASCTGDGPSCYGGSTCPDGYCRCDEGYEANENGLCVDEGSITTTTPGGGVGGSQGLQASLSLLLIVGLVGGRAML